MLPHVHQSIRHSCGFMDKESVSMQVIKVMNNSLILAVDSLGNECILMGKGIGYNQAIGNDVQLSQVEKIFLLKDKQFLLDFVHLANQLDETYFHIVRDIIAYAQQHYQLSVMDSLYLSLTDHIAFMVKRFYDGHLDENFSYLDVIQCYKDEYQIGKFALNLINERLAMSLPESEASAIALHFVNAALNSPKEEHLQVSQLVKNIETVISRSTHLIFDRDSFSYSRFLTHLNYFAKRIIQRNPFNDDKSTSLYQQMSANLTLEKSVVEAIERFIQQQHKLTLSSQEQFYLLIHLHRIISETR